MEPGMVSVVSHGSLGTARFDQGVFAADHVSVTALMLGLDISGVVVVDAVTELVLGVVVRLGGVVSRGVVTVSVRGRCDYWTMDVLVRVAMGSEDCRGQSHREDQGDVGLHF